MENKKILLFDNENLIELDMSPKEDEDIKRLY